MFHFGFSYVGILYLLMLFVPNILWTKYLPEGYEDSAKKENKVLLTFERIGEVLTCVIVLVFYDFNPRKTIWVTWLVISFVFMILYEIYWIRYFKSEHTMMDMYSSLFGIPVAGATLPIISFVFLGIYGSNVFLLVSVIILRNKVYQYRLIEIEDKATWMAVVSPYFGVDDLRWFFIQLGDFGEYVKRNQQLFDFTFDFNIYD